MGFNAKSCRISIDRVYKPGTALIRRGIKNDIAAQSVTSYGWRSHDCGARSFPAGQMVV